MKPNRSERADHSHVRARGEDPDLDDAVDGVLAEIQESLGAVDEPLLGFEALDEREAQQAEKGLGKAAARQTAAPPGGDHEALAYRIRHPGARR